MSIQIPKELHVVEKNNAFKGQAPVVQTLDSTIHQINHYPPDKYYGNQLCYLVDSDLSGG